MPLHSGYLLDEGGPEDTLSVKLGTRESEHIPNTMRPEWAPEDLRRSVNDILREFPDMEVRSVTATYNCVGMVFATRRTWVDPEHVAQLLYDDNYKQVKQITNAKLGDVVVYKANNGEILHVGIIIEKALNLITGTLEIKILSKWGPWAEFIHRPEEIYRPWGTLVEVWTDRKRP